MGNSLIGPILAKYTFMQGDVYNLLGTDKYYRVVNDKIISIEKTFSKAAQGFVFCAIGKNKELGIDDE